MIKENNRGEFREDAGLRFIAVREVSKTYEVNRSIENYHLSAGLNKVDLLNKFHHQ
jgi:hypothetical protein